MPLATGLPACLFPACSLFPVWSLSSDGLLHLAFKNIYKFHSSQVITKKKIQIQDGIHCWQEKRPINNVGFYIPGGTAPLFSTVLMLGIPSLIAKCSNRILCSPPNKNLEISPEILYACKVCGIKDVFMVGGAQAIAAMTFGTESIPKVDKIFGPGNQYVTEAKQYSMNFGISIDMPAGPSELLILADNSINFTSNPFFFDIHEKYKGSIGIQCPPIPGPGLKTLKP